MNDYIEKVLPSEDDYEGSERSKDEGQKQVITFSSV